MPGWRPIAKRASTTVVMVSLLPMAVFYGSMSLFGLRTAVLTTVGWYYAGLLLKVVRRKPVLAAAMVEVFREPPLHAHGTPSCR